MSHKSDYAKLTQHSFHVYGCVQIWLDTSGDKATSECLLTSTSSSCTCVRAKCLGYVAVNNTKHSQTNARAQAHHRPFTYPLGNNSAVSNHFAVSASRANGTKCPHFAVSVSRANGNAQPSQESAGERSSWPPQETGDKACSWLMVRTSPFLRGAGLVMTPTLTSPHSVRMYFSTKRIKYV